MQRSNSLCLDLEAANYFRLDPRHLQLLAGAESSTSSQHKSQQLPATKTSSTMRPTQVNMTKYISQDIKLDKKTKQSNLGQQSFLRVRPAVSAKPEATVNSKSPIKCQTRPQKLKITELKRSSSTKTNNKALSPRGGSQSLFCSSSASNSLPSISSSPSLSPSLVCPHVSLDDLLATSSGTQLSPHTIGLCPQCRKNPPPNCHSPLSPSFRPSASSLYIASSLGSAPNLSFSAATTRKVSQPGAIRGLKRGFSDHHESRARLRDDSLDYCLAPSDLRRMQMSPIQLHGVEYMRKHSIEAGRVFKIYKNGLPYDKPLRVCITRGEFKSIEHLLDYINSRQSIPNGARYLFHLDGQLAYSINELKHGSIYVVSGSRAFNYKSSEIIKQRECREWDQIQLHMRHELRRQHSNQSALRESYLDLKSNPKVASLNFRPQNDLYDDYHDDYGTSTLQKTPTRSRETQAKHGHEAGTMREFRQRANSVTSNRNHVNSSIQVVDKRRDRSRSTSSSNKAPTSPTYNKHSASTTATSSSQSTGTTTSGSSKTPRQSLPFDRIDSLNLNSKIKSSESLSEQSGQRLVQAVERPTKKSLMSRAKSELTSANLARQKKKSVTFIDTQRGSSPNISTKPDIKSNKLEEAKPMSVTSASDLADEIAKTLGTSDVGIQVSDSIEGFLVDLPIILPQDKTKPDGVRRSTSGQTTRGRQRGKSTQVGQRRPRKIVTIHERQLSRDELNVFKDLDSGDHHHEKPVVVIDEAPERKPSDDEANEAELQKQAENDKVDAEAVSELGKTVAIGQNPSIEGETTNRLTDQGTDRGWHSGSSTPIERPVSQSGPNQEVNARVTTPTPSLSTTQGDSSSLAMSYEAPPNWRADGSDNTNNRMQGDAMHTTFNVDRFRKPVRASLVEGLDAPSRSFELLWIHGLSISNHRQQPELNIASSNDNTNNNITVDPSSQLLRLASPSSPAKHSQQTPARPFKPSERYSNWICHSKLYNELVYPVGRMVVLWCRSNGEQRYYSGHESCICALTLDEAGSIGVSSQSRDSADSSIVESVHIWSLKTLEILKVVRDDHFLGRDIFTLALTKLDMEAGKSQQTLTVGAKDDRRLIVVQLTIDTDDKNTTQLPLRAFKTLQPNNHIMPLAVMMLKSNSDKSTSNKRKNLRMQTEEPWCITLGKRHLQAYLGDKTRKLLHLLARAESGSADDLSRQAMQTCTCFARWSRSKVLTGDNEGNVHLMQFELIKTNTQNDSNSAKNSPKKPQVEQKKPKVCFTVKTITKLFSISQVNGEASSTSGFACVTCLAKIGSKLLVSGDSTGTIRFWKCSAPSNNGYDGDSKETKPSNYGQVSSINLPRDLGYICTIVIANYDTTTNVVDLYLITTSNAILFGSIQLPGGTGDSASSGDIINHSSLTVVYEGHETHATGLVADVANPQRSKTKTSKSTSQSVYFTCSLDSKICKWSGKSLLWKSMLPSACASLAVHPVGFVLAVGSTDGTVYILDKFSGLLISYFPLTPVCINCLAYSRNGDLMAAGCANGSIFVLPVQDKGLKYDKVSIFQSPLPVVSIQFSLCTKFILTSVVHGHFQELILWDLPNFRFMRDNVKLEADKICWFDSICSGSEDVRAIWENANANVPTAAPETTTTPLSSNRKFSLKQQRTKAMVAQDRSIVNLSCHRLIWNANQPGSADQSKDSKSEESNLAIASDLLGYLRLFKYPCNDIDQGFYQIRVGSSPVNCCRFLSLTERPSQTSDARVEFVSTSLDGSICLWSLTSN